MGQLVSNGIKYSGGGGGHTIIDPNGTTMPNRSKLKFTGSASVMDDSANDQTVINVTGGGGEYYLNDGLIGSSGGTYVTCNLDKTLVNGYYLVVVNDSLGSTYYNYMEWNGTTQTLSIGNWQLQITSTTAGLTYYSGNWRNIYCDILSLGGSGSVGGVVKHEVIHQTNVEIYDNTQIVLNLQNKYTDPVVFATNALPLTSWGGIIVVQDQTVVYDSANDTLTFNVYTNSGQTYGQIDWIVMDKVSSSGGSGGSSISYGYVPPQNSSTDGSLYYLLNSIDKKLGEFLYMSDHWVLVSGTSFTKELMLLARKAQRNYSEGTTVYAVTQTSRLLCINININSSADTQTLASTISGGTLVDSVELQTDYGNSIRNHISNVSLIDADNGDSITLGNVSNGNYVVQLHAIFEVFGLDSITDINVYDYLIKTDGDMGLSKTFNLNGLYLLICLESSGNNATDMGVDITYDGEDYTAEYAYEHGIFACKVMIVDAKVASTITFKWSDKSSFVSRGYLIYSLS